MTRDELREKVKADIEFYYGNSSDVAPLAEDILSTIFVALKEPTEGMVLEAGKAWGITVTSNEYENMEDEWRLMLSASPLKPKE